MGAWDNKLAPYRAKRNFGATPEPMGEEQAAASARPRFVIQEHHASHLHWDLRLEHNGVLVSWAVPRGIPTDPSRNNLAVHTEDHPMRYYDFQGVIPEGQYGAGEMYIWDQGTYDPLKFEDKKVVVNLHGKRTQGKYALFQTNGKNWMLHRIDPPVDPTAEPLPLHVLPQLARLGPLPADERRFGYEIKWDGVRAIGFIDNGRLRLESRNLLDITAQYPELKELGESLGSRSAVLDGEIVAFDKAGKPSFSRLQTRMHVGSPAVVKRRMRDVPVTYMIFDLLYFEGHSLMSMAYEDRRRKLDALGLNGPAWQTPPYYRDGAALLAASRAQGLEGIVAKRIDAPYLQGRREAVWLKIKNPRRGEFVIAGWYPGEGNRENRIGSLLLGYYEANAQFAIRDSQTPLRFAGKVGTGFTEKELKRLQELLVPLRRVTTPFTGAKQPQKHAVFCEPQYVAAVEYTEWTHERTLRHPSYKGIVEHADPRDSVCVFQEEES